MKLNLGCGRDYRDGWVNVDHPRSDVRKDIGWDFAAGVDLDADTVEHAEAKHVLEHLADPLAFMSELWRITRPDGTATFRLPYGSSDDAWEDPTHARPYFLHSFGYFGQPYYWRADYGYRSDWQPERIRLFPHPDYRDVPHPERVRALEHDRNVVAEMIVELRCVKPARRPLRELQVPPVVEFVV